MCCVFFRVKLKKPIAKGVYARPKKMKTTTKFKSGGQKKTNQIILKSAPEKKHRIRQSLAGYNLSYFVFLCVSHNQNILKICLKWKPFKKKKSKYFYLWLTKCSIFVTLSVVCNRNGSMIRLTFVRILLKQRFG